MSGGRSGTTLALRRTIRHDSYDSRVVESFVREELSETRCYYLALDLIALMLANFEKVIKGIRINVF